MKDISQDDLIAITHENFAHALSLLVSAVAKQLDGRQLALDLEAYLAIYEQRPHPLPAIRPLLRDSIANAHRVGQQQAGKH